MKMSFLLAALLLASWNASHAAEPLTVTSDFDGASVRDVGIDEATRSIRFKKPYGSSSGNMLAEVRTTFGNYYYGSAIWYTRIGHVVGEVMLEMVKAMS